MRTPPRGVIVEPTALVVAHPSFVVHDLPDTAVDASVDEGSTAELRRLMDLADLYARKVVATADAPPGVLLLVHGGELEVVDLDGPDPDVRALPRLLARRWPSSAAVVVTIAGVLAGMDDVVLVVGETSDGLRDEHRFRVRACGRTRRLTRLPDHSAVEAPTGVPRLFPPSTAAVP